MFFAALALCALWRYFRSPRRRWCLLLGLAIGLMYATKETSVIYCGAMGAAYGCAHPAAAPPRMANRCGICAAVQACHLLLAVRCGRHGRRVVLFILFRPSARSARFAAGLPPLFRPQRRRWQCRPAPASMVLLLENVVLHQGRARPVVERGTHSGAGSRRHHHQRPWARTRRHPSRPRVFPRGLHPLHDRGLFDDSLQNPMEHARVSPRPDPDGRDRGRRGFPSLALVQRPRGVGGVLAVRCGTTRRPGRAGQLPLLCRSAQPVCLCPFRARCGPSWPAASTNSPHCIPTGRRCAFISSRPNIGPCPIICASCTGSDTGTKSRPLPTRPSWSSVPNCRNHSNPCSATAITRNSTASVPGVARPQYPTGSVGPLSGNPEVNKPRQPLVAAIKR